MKFSIAGLIGFTRLADESMPVFSETVENGADEFQKSGLSRFVCPIKNIDSLRKFGQCQPCPETETLNFKGCNLHGKRVDENSESFYVPVADLSR